MWDVWDVIKAPFFKKSRRDWGFVLCSHDRKGGNCKRMNSAGKGNSCRGWEVWSKSTSSHSSYLSQRRYSFCSSLPVLFGARKYVNWETVTLWRDLMAVLELVMGVYQSRDTWQHDGGTEIGRCVSCFWNLRVRCLHFGKGS